MGRQHIVRQGSEAELVRREHELPRDEIDPSVNTSAAVSAAVADVQQDRAIASPEREAFIAGSWRDVSPSDAVSLRPERRRATMPL